MAKQKATAPAEAPSRKCARTKVSHATMRKELATIAERSFSRAFNEMFKYIFRVNPGGHSYVRQYLKAMRDQLEELEATQPGGCSHERRHRFANPGGAFRPSSDPCVEINPRVLPGAPRSHPLAIFSAHCIRRTTARALLRLVPVHGRVLE